MGQGRWLDMPDSRVMADSPRGRGHVSDFVEVVRIVNDGVVDDRLVDIGDPGYIAW
jgi:hypothetical protein